MSRPSPDQLVNCQYLTACTVLSVSTTSAFLASDLASGLYAITCDTDCYFVQGTSGVAATVASGVPLWAKTYVNELLVDNLANARIAGITSTGSGKLWLIPKVSR